MKKNAQLLISILICQLAGFIGAIFTMPAIPTWYNTLAMPSFSPPSWLFAPVWITLYTMMGISFFLVWIKKSSSGVKQTAKTIFFIQLLLNALWSPSFFGLRSPIAGLIVIILLWITIVLTIAAFHKISKNSARILIPYFLWVSFALVLNFSIWWLN